MTPSSPVSFIRGGQFRRTDPRFIFHFLFLSSFSAESPDVSPGVSVTREIEVVRGTFETLQAPQSRARVLPRTPRQGKIVGGWVTRFYRVDGLKVALRLAPRPAWPQRPFAFSWIEETRSGWELWILNNAAGTGTRTSPPPVSIVAPFLLASSVAHHGWPPSSTGNEVKRSFWYAGKITGSTEFNVHTKLSLLHFVAPSTS